MTAAIKNIINAIADNGGKFIDGHRRNVIDATRTTKYVVVCKNGERMEVSPFHNTPFCLNPLTVKDDGLVHLSTRSFGPTVMGRGDGIYDAIARIEALNAEMEAYSKEIGYDVWMVAELHTTTPTTPGDTLIKKF